jgi:anti-sigma-K factor RskA
MELSHEAIRDLIAPYVLGAVSPEEEREIRNHILSCDECTREAESYAAVTTALPLTADAMPLPVGFVDRVVAQVHDARPGPSQAPGPAHAPWYRRWSSFGALATAALLIVTLSAGTILVNEHNDLEQKQKVVAALLHHEQDGIALKGPGPAAGKVIPTSTGSIFVAAGMHKPPKEHTYQLWLIKNGTMISAGTFTAKGDLVVLETNRSLSGVDSAAITIEPAGGSQQPTTQPITTSSTV